MKSCNEKMYTCISLHHSSVVVMKSCNSNNAYDYCALHHWCVVDTQTAAKKKSWLSNENEFHLHMCWFCQTLMRLKFFLFYDFRVIVSDNQIVSDGWQVRSDMWATTVTNCCQYLWLRRDDATTYRTSNTTTKFWAQNKCNHDTQH